MGSECFVFISTILYDNVINIIYFYEDCALAMLTIVPI